MVKPNVPPPPPPTPPTPEPLPQAGKTVECPECETDTPLDEDGQGECPNCGLDVGWVVEKARRDEAVDKYKQRKKEERGDPPPKKDKPTWGF